jgi:hypothetical protein
MERRAAAIAAASLRQVSSSWALCGSSASGTSGAYTIVLGSNVGSEIDDAHPVIVLPLALAGKEQEITGTGDCDVPAPGALAAHLISFGGLDQFVIGRSLVKDLEMRCVIRSPVQKGRIVIELGRRIDRDDNRPFESLGQVHGYNRDRVGFREGQFRVTTG